MPSPTFSGATNLSPHRAGLRTSSKKRAVARTLIALGDAEHALHIPAPGVAATTLVLTSRHSSVVVRSPVVLAGALASLLAGCGGGGSILDATPLRFQRRPRFDRLQSASERYHWATTPSTSDASDRRGHGCWVAVLR